MLLQNLSSFLTHQYHFPLNLKLILSFPQNQNLKLRFSHRRRRRHHGLLPPLIAATASFGFPVLCNSFSTCYYFQLKIKLHTQCPGTLAFLFLFSLNLSFSIETKQRKGSLLNDEIRGNISLFFFFFLFFF